MVRGLVIEKKPLNFRRDLFSSIDIFKLLWFCRNIYLIFCMGMGNVTLGILDYSFSAELKYEV